MADEHPAVRSLSPPITWEAAVPFKAWLTAPALRRRSTLIFVGMVVAPAAIFTYLWQLPNSRLSAYSDFKYMGWSFGAYICVAWLIALWFLVRPRLVAWHAAVVIVLAIVTEVPLAVWLETRLRQNTGQFIPAVFTVGLPEELAKFIPLVVAVVLTRLFVPHRMRSWLDLSPRSYLFLGAISGLAFGAAEEAHYLSSVYVPQLLTSQNPVLGIYAFTAQVTLRLITDPIGHACWAGVTGYFIGIAIQRLRREGRAAGPARYAREVGIALIGLAIAAVLHGANDDFVTGGYLGLWLLVTAISALLIVAYAAAGDAVEKGLIGTTPSHWTFRVGDAVKLPSDPQPTFHTGTHQVAWKKAMSEYLNRLATITALDTDRTARLDLDGGTNWWALDWLRPELKRGDRVRIPPEPQPPYDAGGYVVAWQPGMDAVRGRRATVTGVKDGTVRLDVGPPNEEWAVDWLDRDLPGGGFDRGRRHGAAKPVAVERETPISSRRSRDPRS